MIPITIEDFAEKTAQNNKDIDKDELIAGLRQTLEAKKNGDGCIICGNPIWAAGSAVTGTNMCFRCMTLEADDSEDYEVYE